MNLLPEPLAPKPLFHPKPLCPESYSRNLNAINLLTSRSQRNRLIPNRLLLNHPLCKFSLWPPHNNQLTHQSTAKGDGRGRGRRNSDQTAKKRFRQ
jgi:hypothetical protein